MQRIMPNSLACKGNTLTMLTTRGGRVLFGVLLGFASSASGPGDPLSTLISANQEGASLSEPRSTPEVWGTQEEGTCEAEQTFPAALRKELPWSGIRGSVQLSEPSPRHYSKGWPHGGPGRNRVKRFRRAAPRKRGGAKLCKPSPRHAPKELPWSVIRGSVQHSKPSPQRYSERLPKTSESAQRSKPFAGPCPEKTRVRQNHQSNRWCGGLTAGVQLLGGEPERVEGELSAPNCGIRSEKRTGSAMKKTPDNSSLPAWDFLNAVTPKTSRCLQRPQKGRADLSAGCCCWARCFDAAAMAVGRLRGRVRSSSPVPNNTRDFSPNGKLRRASGITDLRLARPLLGWSGGASNKRWNIARACGGEGA